jgi:glutathione S-transferase
MDLHVFRAATTSRAVLAFCDAANLDVTVKDVDIMQGEHHRFPFSTLNPNRMVPVLVDDGFVLTEASAILRYLANKTHSPLYPDDLRVRAHVDELLAWFEANFYRDFGFQYVYPQIMPHHRRGSDEGTTRTVEWGREQSKKWLAILDRHWLARGPYLTGDALTIADFFGVSILSLGELVKFPLDEYPNVRRWYDAVTKHPSWMKINAAFAGFVSSVTS